MARISELHYSNAYANSSGINEFLEVALGTGEGPGDFSVAFYQSNGQQGLVVALTASGVGVTVDPDNGETVYTISADNFNMFLTDPDGSGSNNYEAYALVDTSGPVPVVIDFYDIGGGTQNILAVDGLAQGATSENVPVPTGPNAATYTLQFNQPDPDTLTYAPVAPGDSGAVCFAAGTKLATLQGHRRIETIAVGDKVKTLDHGYQPVRWAGGVEVAATGALAPIEFAPGALGNKHALRVSPQHRMLIQGVRAHMICGASQVLIAAVHLVNGRSVRRVEGGTVRYHHLLFDRHEIIKGNGVWSESLYLGAQTVASLHEAAVQELLTLFPDLYARLGTGAVARPVARHFEGALCSPA